MSCQLLHNPAINLDVEVLLGDRVLMPALRLPGRGPLWESSRQIGIPVTDLGMGVRQCKCLDELQAWRAIIRNGFDAEGLEISTVGNDQK